MLKAKSKRDAGQEKQMHDLRRDVQSTEDAPAEQGGAAGTAVPPAPAEKMWRLNADLPREYKRRTLEYISWTDKKIRDVIMEALDEHLRGKGF